MTTADVVAAFDLPSEALVQKRVTKKLLLEHGVAASGDKKAINEGIEELTWVAALKPATIGVPAFQDAERQYLEIAILTLQLRPEAKPGRLRQLIHRAIPYPTILIAAEPKGVFLSLAQLRQAQNEASKMVLEEEVLTARPPSKAWLRRLALCRQTASDLYSLYSAWHTLLQPVSRLAALEERMDAIRRAAEREPQVGRRVDLNLELKQLKSQAARLAGNLTEEERP